MFPVPMMLMLLMMGSFFSIFRCSRSSGVWPTVEAGAVFSSRGEAQVEIDDSRALHHAEWVLEPELRRIDLDGGA